MVSLAGFPEIGQVTTLSSRLPDLPDWETSEGDWAKGLEEFNRFEEVQSATNSV